MKWDVLCVRMYIPLTAPGSDSLASCDSFLLGASEVVSSEYSSWVLFLLGESLSTFGDIIISGMGLVVAPGQGGGARTDDVQFGRLSCACLCPSLIGVSCEILGVVLNVTICVIVYKDPEAARGGAAGVKTKEACPA